MSMNVGISDEATHDGGPSGWGCDCALVVGVVPAHESQQHHGPNRHVRGEDCEYDRPANLGTNTEATSTFVNESEVDDPGFTIWKVPAGATAEDLNTNGIRAVVGEDEGFVEFVRDVTPSCTSKTVTVIFTEPGTVARVSRGDVTRSSRPRDQCRRTG
jgi:hypothetical protein